MKDMLMTTWGFSEENITMLLDEEEGGVAEEMMPTKANIEVRRGMAVTLKSGPVSNSFQAK
jgi:hypothetical protein